MAHQAQTWESIVRLEKLREILRKLDEKEDYAKSVLSSVIINNSGLTIEAALKKSDEIADEIMELKHKENESNIK